MTRDLAVAKEVRDAGHELIRQMGDHFIRERTECSEIIFVPVMIFTRIVHTYDAIESLVSNEFYAEAAVLVLTQFELRLDLAYTASSIEHATKWISHEDTKWPVLSIEKKLKYYFPGLLAEKMTNL